MAFYPNASWAELHLRGVKLRFKKWKTCVGGNVKITVCAQIQPFHTSCTLRRSPVWFVRMHLFLQDIRFKVHASCSSTIKLRNSFVLYTRFYFYKSIPLKLRCASDVQSIKRIFLSQLEKRLEMGCMLGSKPKHWNNWFLRIFKSLLWHILLPFLNKQRYMK